VTFASYIDLNSKTAAKQVPARETSTVAGNGLRRNRGLRVNPSIKEMMQRRPTDNCF
jgi:hypothetical protein